MMRGVTRISKSRRRSWSLLNQRQSRQQRDTRLGAVDFGDGQATDGSCFAILHQHLGLGVLGREVEAQVGRRQSLHRGALEARRVELEP